MVVGGVSVLGYYKNVKLQCGPQFWSNLFFFLRLADKIMILAEPGRAFCRKS